MVASRLIAVGAALLSLAACDSSEKAPLPAAGVGEAISSRPCPDSLSPRECARLEETGRIARSAVVSRDGLQLKILVPGRESVAFSDSPDSDETGHSFFYQGELATIRAHLVKLQLYEGVEFVLVSSQTGRVVLLDDVPIVSPDNRRFLTASWDTEAGYSPNRARIYRLEGDSAVIEWELSPSAWGPDSARWLDAKTAVIRRAPGLGQDSTTMITPVTLTFRAGAWAVDSVSRAP